ncbi:type II toxin-antitoxin system VapC family toxin [Microbacterium sp. ASV49]|uniref:Ribonuclease VapC n=1 Tax=Microbacterium candidum TaxID=3041922 RepID=A0ABT7MWT9_9MICO|nr:type II toxin-antitoxin system VapC family toxin [Microbacterium sp. ASV49]MDL9978918.1 type II toxin-antitoxin system VapC family toxin [Microbacterium sp. ASV49]
MIVDTSALIALLKAEPHAPAILAAFEGDGDAAISAATLLEASIVADGSRDPVRSARFTALLDALELEVVSFDAEQADVARRAYRDYGRGSGHPAGLNLGDCFAYALATTRRDSLLFVGDDFTRTDLSSVLPDPRPTA